jgi:hypothetical protein
MQVVEANARSAVKRMISRARGSAQDANEVDSPQGNDDQMTLL